jgi:hypothetical protein
MAGEPTLAASPPGDGLDEAAALWWREEVSPASLRRDERRWTVWTAWIAAVFVAPGLLLLYLEPLTAPVAAICFAHAWLIPWIQARRGADQVEPIGAAGAAGARPRPERVAIGFLGDLVGHRERELLHRSGLVLERGRLGVWLLGERGAFLVRPGGRRVDCWCVRVGDASELPAADRAAHLLLGLREDELGFAKVANLSFSGGCWRVRRRLTEPAAAALARARELAAAA